MIAPDPRSGQGWCDCYQMGVSGLYGAYRAGAYKIQKINRFYQIVMFVIKLLQTSPIPHFALKVNSFSVFFSVFIIQLNKRDTYIDK